MRRFLHRNRWFTISVVALLMFATSGMMLSRMTCLIGGHSTLSIGLIDDCCPDTEPGQLATIAAQCCEVGQTDQFDINFVGHGSLDLIALLLDVDAAPFALITSPEPVAPVWLESRPPPEEAGDRLATLGSLLI